MSLAHQIRERAPAVGVTWHPYAELFPWIEGPAFEELKADIAKNGVLEPIVFLDGAILDGRNRYMAARDLDIEYPRVEYVGDDPLGFVISLNLKRRHLSESQRGMVAAKLAKLPPHRPVEGNSANLRTSDAAEMLNVSSRTVETARRVVNEGAPELVAAVETGKVSVSAAADIASKPKEEQVEIVARGEKEILEAAKAIRAEKAVAKREERLEKIAEISKGNRELATDVRYPIIYADPPWRYENPPMGGTNRSIENHYPTMTLEEICAMPVADLATDDAMLYLWATAPKLAECMKVIEAWGFEYRTNLVWDKEVIGMGYHARNQHEILLVAKRGSIPPPEAGKQPSSVHRERRAEHSAKPDFYYEMIEAAYPQLPKIELFCRSPRDGWSVWGNQSEVADAA
jgi:N6-adenosine-specific RNA methylase IME4/ParB-like chromosome segregation protein Spo0J